MSNLTNPERLQKQHFDNIIFRYEAHYGDVWSQKYRLQFVYGYLFEGVNLAGSKVLEAMCGSGQCTDYLLSQGALVTGLDISEEAIRSLKDGRPSVNVTCASILNSAFKSNSFDCVMLFTGLHHLHPNIEKAIDEVWRVLKPGGYFCFVEPHSGSLPDLIRKLWYKCDPLFEKNEGSINLSKLTSECSSLFKFVRVKYFGNLAYLFVFQSMVLRIPLRFKSLYAPFFFSLEGIVNRFQGKIFSCAVICQWQKK